ncbi:hypothetical protein B0H63DRAFT_565954 [Podospora didyma]|uniref:Fungal-type protein kinase domain-containing protein n=1 Tax=Podospora didyma TaxID=330526 RepID=A0AAE0N198_9PEZI|nr:hypothetical protein B0H63DRAFT_565954 [Podospora didyma]
MDIGFVNDPSAGKNSRCHWIQILMPSELRSNPSADIPSEAQLREVLAAQDTRRFDLGFTLCRSLMRIWVSDRLGGIASEQFNINKDGLRQGTFVDFSLITLPRSVDNKEQKSMVLFAPLIPTQL